MLLHPWDFPVKSTGVGCHFLLQGIFLTQGLNPSFLHWQTDFFTTEPPWKPPNVTVLLDTSVVFWPKEHCVAANEWAHICGSYVY